MQEKHQNKQQVGEPLAVSREQSNVLSCFCYLRIGTLYQFLWDVGKNISHIYSSFAW